MTWKGESRRHSLARKGIRTVVPKIAHAIPNKIKITPDLFPTFENNAWIEDSPQGIVVKSSMGNDRIGIYDKNGTYIRTIKNIEENPYDYFYHATNIDALKGIVDRGLIANRNALWGESGDYNYFTEEQAGAIGWLYYGRMFEGDAKEIPYVLLRVKHENPEIKWIDDQMGSMQGLISNTSWATQNNILPEQLDVYTLGGWIPLTELYFGYQSDLGEYN